MATFLYTGCTVTCVTWRDAFTAENSIRTINQLTASKDFFRAKRQDLYSRQHLKIFHVKVFRNRSVK